MKIGVFDSGVGGLSVLKSLLDSGLFSEIIYYGDTARVPYGNKDKGTIVRFSLEAVEFFAPHKIDMLIIACNTVSAHALDKMQEIAPFPIIGVVESGVLSLSNKIKNKKDSILIIATKATIESGIYEKNLRALGYENLISLQTGLFVPLVEEGIVSGEILEATMRYYFGALNSSLGAPFALGENFGNQQTSSLVLSQNFRQDTKSLPQILELDSSKSDSADLSLRGKAEAIQKNNNVDCHDSTQCVESRNDENIKNANSSIVSESQRVVSEAKQKSGLCSHERGNKTKASIDEASGKLHDLSPQDEFATPNAIILGCTHFPLIQDSIKKYFDNKPILIHSGEAIVEFLKQKYTLSSSHKLPKVHFYASGDKSTLESYAKLWLNS